VAIVAARCIGGISCLLFEARRDVMEESVRAMRNCERVILPTAAVKQSPGD
jgi:hypothetical protein